jgi:hypothetical protein
MMTLPSSAQLIAVIRAELTDTFGARKDDPQAVACLEMTDSMLAAIAVRCEHELAWMIAEVDDIIVLAQSLVDGGHDADGRIAAGLTGLRGAQRVDFEMQTVRATYHQASALLADCVELAVNVGGEARRRAEASLATRLDHEREVRGALELVRR